MENIFGDNLGILYILGCVAVMGYTHFAENQHMFLLYIFTYTAALLGVFRIAMCLLLLAAVTFAYLEYLSSDTWKLTLVTRIPYKMLDYFFMMVSQYHVLWVLASFLLLHVSHYTPYCEGIKIGCRVLSVLTMFVGLHLTISQPFKIKTFSEMMVVFETNPPYKFQYHEQMQPRFDMLCAFEDKTYFMRKGSYSSFSPEYVIASIRRKGRFGLRLLKILLGVLLLNKKTLRRIKRFLFRGHSTPEMQIIRTIGVVRGYDRYKLQRKLFEILYGKIFFASLKAYHKKNTILPMDDFRHYLLSVHFKVCEIRIHRKRYVPLASAFENPEDFKNWSLEGLFVACFGLSRWTMTEEKLDACADIIRAFQLDRKNIWEIYNHFPQKKLPMVDSAPEKKVQTVAVRKLTV